MPISQSNQVFNLVKSLSKSEKRNFRLYSGRIQDRNDLMYLKLFDVLDKSSDFEDKLVLKKMGNLSSVQYSNLKRHLYLQILISLRHLHKEKKAYIKIREYIDFAYILYDKGLYIPALKILDKAKKISLRNFTDFSALTIIEIEKMIQSRHITRTNTASIEALVGEAFELGETISSRVKISNLQVLLHRYYIKNGHVRNKKEEENIKSFFNKNIQNFKITRLGMMEKVFFFQSYVWYYYILNDFEKCYDYAFKWVELFEKSEELLRRDVDLYLRGYHYLMTSAFNTQRLREYRIHLEDLERFRHEKYNTFNNNTKITSFFYVHFGRMNLHFLQGSFDLGVDGIKKTLLRMKRYKEYIDQHKAMILNYKIAWMYTGNEMYKKANQHLLNIINDTSFSLREDIQIYARLMHMMLHVDTESYDILNYLIKNYRKYIVSTKDKNIFHELALRFFSELARQPILERKRIYSKYLKEFSNLRKDKYAQRAFLYLDIISWLESKVENQPISKVIKKKMKFAT